MKMTISRETYLKLRELGVDYTLNLMALAIDFNTDTQEYEMIARHPTRDDL